LTLMSSHDEAWRRPPGDTGGAPANPPTRAPLTRPTPRPEDTAWAKPAAAPAGKPARPDAGPAEPAADPVSTPYAGPPPTNPPPGHWRPPIVAQPAPPGTLPEQNHDRLDVEEQAARTLTTGIGLVAGAILLVLLLVICARNVF
jgi:hypothetical protein